MANTATPAIFTISGDGRTVTHGVTQDRTPMLLGLGEAGSLIWLYEDGIQYGDPGLADANGRWTLEPTTPLPLGQHDLFVVATQPDGSNPSTPSGVSLLIDPLAPVFPPYVMMPIDDTGAVQGWIKDGATDDTQPTLIGSGTPDTLAKLYDNGIELGTTPVLSDGTWAFTPPTELAAGDHVFTTSGSRLDGGAVIVSNFPPTRISIGPDAPVLPPPKIDMSDSPPVITSVVDDVGAHRGSMRGDRGLTDDTRPTINGTSYLSAPVEIFDNGVKIGDARPDYYLWSFTPPAPLEPGLHAFTARINSPDALQPISTVYPFELQIGSVDTFDQTMLAPVITGVLQPGFSYFVPGMPSGEHVPGRPGVHGHVPDGGATDETLPMISGTAQPGTRVAVSDNGQLIGEAVTGSDWIWYLTPPENLTSGEHTFTATAYWQAEGDIGTPAPTAYSVSVGTGEVSIRTPVITGFTDTTESILQGTAQPGCKLEIFDSDIKIGEAAVGDDWQWQFTPPVTDPTLAYHNYTALSTTPHGEASAVSWTVGSYRTPMAAYGALDTLLDTAGLPATPAASSTTAASPADVAALPTAQAAVFSLEPGPAHHLAY